MAETSIFPSAIDGYEQIPLIVDGVTEVRANSINPLRCAIINIEEELGPKPSRTFSNIGLRLDDLEDRLKVVEETGGGGSGGGGGFSGPGDELEINFTPTYYSITENKLGSHLQGIDSAIGVLQAGSAADNRLIHLDLTINNKIPSGGIRYFSIGDVVTSSAPILSSRDYNLVISTVRTNSTDTNDYRVVYLINGSISDTMSFPGGNLSASKEFASFSILEDDEISIYMERISGSGESTFSNVTLTIELEEG